MRLSIAMSRSNATISWPNFFTRGTKGKGKDDSL